MKRLTCEMCGSTDLIKKDGVFECQSCGCKYSVEEAKKMMVEGTVEVQGTVKLDSSEELKNLYELARRAKKDRNWDNAAKYYEMITIKDPNNWEPAFYSVFSKATTCTIGDIHIAGNSIYNCVQSTIELINNTISDKSAQIQAYTEVTNQVVEIIKALNNLARKQFDKYTPQMKEIFKEKFFTNISPTVCTMYELGDKLDLFFGSDIEANKLSVIVWKQGIEFERSLIPYLNDSEFIRNNINKYEKKISKYDSSFEIVVESDDILLSLIESDQLTEEQRKQEQLEHEKKEEQKRIEQKIKVEQRRIKKATLKKKIKNLAVVFIGIVVLISVLLTLMFVNESIIVPRNKYKEAVLLMETEKYDEAITIFTSLNGFSDSNTKIDECNYNKAVLFSDAGNLDEAYESFVRAGNYKDTYELLAPIAYSRGVKLLDEGKIREAMGCFVNSRGYEDAENYLINWNAKTISVGAHSIVGLKSNGTVVAVVSDVFDNGQGNVSGWTDIVAISAGDSHTVGLKSDGTVVAVGDNYKGQCNVDSWTDIVAISAGGEHTVGLKSDGTVVAVGYNHSGECEVSDWTDIVAISACSSYTIGLKSNGTVVATGLSDDDISHISNWTDIIAIDGDLFDVFGLKSNGTVVQTPSFNSIDASKLTNVVAISACPKHTVVLNFDGTVFADGANYSGECNVDSWTDIVAISAGGEHTVGLKSDGTVVAKGFEVDSVFDVSDWTDIKQPTKY